MSEDKKKINKQNKIVPSTSTSNAMQTKKFISKRKIFKSKSKITNKSHSPMDRLTIFHKTSTFFIPMAFQANFLNENDFNSILDQLEDFNSINTNQENGLTTTVELIEQSNISSTSYMNLMNEIINKVKNQGYSSNGKSIQEEAREFKMTIFEINEVGDELLKFWATQKFKFPKLYQASRFYLAIPATSLIIERHFNITGMIINSKRSSLKSDNLNYSSFIKFNLDKFDFFK